MKNYLYRLFKINRKCYCCECVDCQETELRHEWWYCLQLKNNICDICCIHDSLDPAWNWKECKKCPREIDRATLNRLMNKKWCKERGYTRVK